MPEDILRYNDRFIYQHPQCDQCTKQGQHIETIADLIRTDTPPALSDKDKRQRTDPEWMVATEQYLAAKRRADAVSAELDEAKASLLRLITLLGDGQRRDGHEVLEAGLRRLPESP